MKQCFALEAGRFPRLRRSGAKRVAVERPAIPDGLTERFHRARTVGFSAHERRGPGHVPVKNDRDAYADFLEAVGRPDPELFS